MEKVKTFTHPSVVHSTDNQAVHHVSLSGLLLILGPGVLNYLYMELQCVHSKSPYKIYIYKINNPIDKLWKIQYITTFNLIKFDLQNNHMT